MLNHGLMIEPDHKSHRVDLCHWFRVTGSFATIPQQTPDSQQILILMAQQESQKNVLLLSVVSQASLYLCSSNCFKRRLLDRCSLNIGESWLRGSLCNAADCVEASEATILCFSWGAAPQWPSTNLYALRIFLTSLRISVAKLLSKSWPYSELRLFPYMKSLSRYFR